MKKPKVLIPISIQFSVRYLVRTGLLQLIQAYAEPVVVLGWQDDDLLAELLAMGIEVFQNPGKQAGVAYYRARNMIDLWHYDHMKSASTSIDRYRNRLFRSPSQNARKKLRDTYFRARTATHRSLNRILSIESSLLHSDTSFSKYDELISKIAPDAIFSITPYFFEEELILRVAQEQGIPICTSILSFDNITTKGWMSVTCDHYCLWNKYNKEELYRIYPQTKGKQVTIVGAPQFDFYYDSSYVWDEKEWRKVVGINNDRPVIFFGSTGRVIAPNEGLWLTQMDDAIESKEIVNNPVILFRRHPNDPMSHWASLLSNCKHVVVDEPWLPGKEIAGKTNITRWDIEKFTSTLKHCIVHVNASSTLSIDGAIFDRPQIAPAYDTDKRLDRVAKELYLREHYLPITNSGGLDIVYSRDEFINGLNQAMLMPEKKQTERIKMVEEIVTFTDGQSTQRVNLALQEFLSDLPSRISAQDIIGYQ